MSATDRVFVYGTLKVGQANHPLVADLVVGARPAVLDDHTLFDSGPYPGARRAPDSHVEGELLVIRAPREALARLDELEAHPTLFRRRRVLVRAGDERLRAWFYELVRLDASWRPCGAAWPPAAA